MPRANVSVIVAMYTHFMAFSLSREGGFTTGHSYEPFMQMKVGV